MPGIVTPWEPLRRIDNEPGWEINPEMIEVHKRTGIPMEDEVWWNNRYQVRVRYVPYSGPCENCGGKGQTGYQVGVGGGPTRECLTCKGTGEPVGTREGLVHLSINVHDRGPMRNWRHFQQIKNEVMGEDRWAVEVFPAEDHLADTSNQYHLWVLPEGEDLGLGFRGRFVSTAEDVERFNSEPHKGQQTPWEPGLTTGRRSDDRSMYKGGGETQEEERPTKPTGGDA